MLDKITVQHVADLARLELTVQEEEKFQKDLSQVLDFFDELTTLEVSTTDTQSEIFGGGREDRVVPPVSDIEQIEINMPRRRDGALEVDSVF